MAGTRNYQSIGEVLVAVKTEFPDITISKIRFLEAEGLIEPERTPSGYRKFYADDVERLKSILRMQRDEYLPLKVIKERLLKQDAGSDETPVDEGGEDAGEPLDHLAEVQAGAAPDEPPRPPPKRVRRRSVRGAVAVLPLLVLVAQTAVGGAVLRTAPPPTPVPPNGSPSPFVSHLEVPADPDLEPHVDADGVLLVDLGYDQVLFRRAERRAQPIASLTKLMTALLVLEKEGRHLDEIVRVPADAVFGRRDYGAGSTLGLHAGERISVRSLLAGLLLGSANDAAEALAIHEAGSVSGFVDRMNARARELHMRDTRFASPHGLDDRGRSSPADLLTLLRRLETFGAFRDLVGERFATIPSTTGPDRRIPNRDLLP